MKSFIISSFMLLGFHAVNPTRILYINSTASISSTIPFFNGVNVSHDMLSPIKMLLCFCSAKKISQAEKWGCLASMFISSVERIFLRVKVHKILNTSIFLREYL